MLYLLQLVQALRYEPENLKETDTEDDQGEITYTFSPAQHSCDIQVKLLTVHPSSHSRTTPLL